MTDLVIVSPNPGTVVARQTDTATVTISPSGSGVVVQQINPAIVVNSGGAQGPAGPPGAGNQFAYAFAFGQVTVYTLGVLPANKRVTSVVVSVEQGFNGVGVGVSVGTAADSQALVASGQVDLTAGVATYEFLPMYSSSTVQTLTLYFSPGVTPTTGTAKLFVYYEL